MVVDIWLNKSHQLVPGAELYDSPRSFDLSGYNPTFGRLLLRNGYFLDGRHDGVRIDILFQSVRVMKLRPRYEGLRICCATEEACERIRRETPHTTYLGGGRYDQGDRFFVLESGSGFDYVVAGAIGWHEDRAPLSWPSYFADPIPSPAIL